MASEDQDIEMLVVQDREDASEEDPSDHVSSESFSTSPPVSTNGDATQLTNGNTKKAAILDNKVFESNDVVNSQNGDISEMEVDSENPQPGTTPHIKNLANASPIVESPKVKHANGISAPSSRPDQLSYATPSENDTAKDVKMGQDYAIPTVERTPASSAAPEQTPSIASKGTTHSVKSAKIRKSEVRSVADQIKIDKQALRLQAMVDETAPEAAQKVLGKNWRKFLFDNLDEDHVAFVLRSLVKNVSEAILGRLARDGFLYKKPIIDAASNRPEIIQKVLKKATPKQLLEHVPKGVLSMTGKDLDYGGPESDESWVGRFKNIPAQRLVNILAKANRLGFSADDIVDTENDQAMPNVQQHNGINTNMADVAEVEGPGARPAHAGPSGYQFPQQQHQGPQSRRQPLPHFRNDGVDSSIHSSANVQQRRERHEAAIARGRADGTAWICPKCQAQAQTFSGYTHHVTKKVCEKPQPKDGPFKWRCENCVQGFTTKQGKDYHQLNQVCTKHSDIAEATPGTSSAQLQGEAETRATSSSKLVITSNSPVPPPGYQLQTQPQSEHQRQMQTPVQAQQPQGMLSTSTPASDRLAKIPKPPMHTPASDRTSSGFTPANATPDPGTSSGRKRKQNTAHEDPRLLPEDLPADKQEELRLAIQEAEDKYEQARTEIPDTWSVENKDAKLQSLKNANASRKSQIRKLFGVTLRMREKDKKARVEMGLVESATSTPANGSRSRAGSASIGSVHLAGASATPSQPSASGTPAHMRPPTTSSFSPINAPRPSQPDRSTRSPSDVSSPSNVSSPVNGIGQPPNIPLSNHGLPDPINFRPTPPPTDHFGSQFRPVPVPSNGPIISQSSNGIPNPSQRPAYRAPPLNAAARTHNPLSISNPHTLTHARENLASQSHSNISSYHNTFDTNQSPFGVLRANGSRPRSSVGEESAAKRMRVSGENSPALSASSTRANLSYFAPNQFDEQGNSSAPRQTNPYGAHPQLARASLPSYGSASASPATTPQVQAATLPTQPPSSAERRSVRSKNGSSGGAGAMGSREIVVLDSSDSEDVCLPAHSGGPEIPKKKSASAATDEDKIEVEDKGDDTMKED